MANIDQKIDDIEKKIEQHRQRLRDLKAQSTKQERKDDARRKILYGAAYLAGLSTLSERQREQSLERIHAHIRAKRDREFLGLDALDDQSTTAQKRDITSDSSETHDLPFTSSTRDST